MEAPGTYHHSLMVGNLAEQAAEAIDADPLVARVAAYYHDVGKLHDPQAFIENQAGENIHDLLPPEESAAIVAGHVARGIDIAYEYKLPKALIGYIPQHHGTALMGYFYAKARQQAAEEIGAGPGSVAGTEAGDRVDQRRFRHAGSEAPDARGGHPHARRRRRGIGALALQPGRARRPDDGRADHQRAAPRRPARRVRPTLRDLDRIRESFIRQLLAMYHRRIPYPTNKIVELESRRSAGRPSA